MLTFASDPWSPYAGEVESENQGYIIDILKAIYSKHGYIVRYYNKPWSRCIEDTRKGNLTALAGADIDEVPDFVFPINTIGITRPAFFVLKDSEFDFKELSSLKDKCLGVIQDYTYEEHLDQYITKNKDSSAIYTVTGNNPLERLIKALKEKRIDAFVENAPVVYYSLKLYGYKVEDFKEAGAPKKGVDLYIPFSPKNPDSTKLAAIFDEGIVKLRKSGELKKILQKYDLEDWVVESDK